MLEPMKVIEVPIQAVSLHDDPFHPEWNYNRIAGINRHGERNERVRH